MFSYCGNNPAVFQDPDGLCREVGALLTWIDCKRSDCPTSRFYIENTATRKARDTLQAFCSNLELSLGVGQGLYYETEILDMVGVQLGMYGNYTEFQIRNGTITWGQRTNTNFSLSLLGHNLGIYENYFKANDGTIETSSNVPLSSASSLISSDDSITIASVAIYPLFAGFSCRLGFDLNRFILDLYEIY